MSSLKYYIRDARNGIGRNIGAALATVLLIFISLSITGVMMLGKTSVDRVVDFMESQVQVKLFLDGTVSPGDMAEVFEKQEYVEDVTIKTKEETLDELSHLFEGKEHLFVAFEDSQFPDQVNLEVKDKEQIKEVTKSLKNVEGISEVFYPQEFAEKILDWSKKVNTYGVVVLGVIIFASFLTVSVAINLSLYQRQKEIRVKLLVGAKESHVRAQFLFEGFLLGLVGSILASFSVYYIYNYVLYNLVTNFGYIFYLSNGYLNWLLLNIILGGSVIGLIGSYVSTRKMIKNA